MSEDGRSNQKARTRAALVAAAAKLVREGKSPSIQDAAAASLISVATAYRYFTSAEDLWTEASLQVSDYEGMIADVTKQIEAAGADVFARAEAATSIVRRMLEDQAPCRQLVKASIERWFALRNGQQTEEPGPVRAGRRTQLNRLVVEPLRGTLTEGELDRLVRALGLVSGVDAMIALADALNLDTRSAMVTLRDANRWLIAGALAEARERTLKGSEGKKGGRKAAKTSPDD